MTGFVGHRADDVSRKRHKSDAEGEPGQGREGNGDRRNEVADSSRMERSKESSHRLGSRKDEGLSRCVSRK
jgi:hypothetical protein